MGRNENANRTRASDDGQVQTTRMNKTSLTSFSILREERRVYRVRGVKKTVSRIFICPCSVCGKEMKLRACSFKRHGGMCLRCRQTRNRRTRPYETLYLHLCRQAVKRGKSNSLTYEQFLEFTEIKNCHYCDAPLVWTLVQREYSTKTFWGYNLDRKENSLGYSKENCVASCSRCNKSRMGYFTYEEWVKIGKVIKAFKDE